MDFYKYSSLFNFLTNSRLSTSLPTKLYLLCSAMLGLMFLHQKGIYHLDFKPQNMLISSGLLLRVNDLGEAYHPDVCGPSYQPSFTPAYSSPEAYHQTGKLSDRSDVYSLGVTIYEVLFEQLPFTIRGNKFDNHFT